MNIDIFSVIYSQDELISHFNSSYDLNKSGVIIQVVQKQKAYRGIDPSAIQAILTLSSVSLGALLKGLFDLAKEKILIRIKKGDSEIQVEIPKNYNQKKIEEILQILQCANYAHIHIP